MHYLIAYDIADPKRLRRVARHMEKHAIRCQKSVFLFRGSPEQLGSVLSGVAALIHEDHDLVQAWQLAPRQSADGRRLGTGSSVLPAAVVLQRGRSRYVDNRCPADDELGSFEE